MDFKESILYYWRRKWQPTPVFLPGKLHEPGGTWQATVHGLSKESDMTEQAHMHSFYGTIFQHLTIRRSED